MATLGKNTAPIGSATIGAMKQHQLDMFADCGAFPQTGAESFLETPPSPAHPATPKHSSVGEALPVSEREPTTRQSTRKRKKSAKTSTDRVKRRRERMRAERRIVISTDIARTEMEQLQGLKPGYTATALLREVVGFYIRHRGGDV